MRTILIYSTFLIFFSYQAIVPNCNENFYHFAHKIREVITTSPFEQDGLKFKETYMDIDTAELWYTWLRGPFLDLVFNSDPGRPGFSGNFLTHGAIIGGIRIGQLRNQPRDCKERVENSWFETNTFSDEIRCYGDSSGMFTDELESREDFGQGFEKFTWAGWNGTDTAFARTRAYHWDRAQSNSWQILPSPGFSVVLPSRDEAAAVEMAKYLQESQYIDSKTAVVFVDLSVYNINLQRCVSLRLRTEFTPAGGANPYVRMLDTPTNVLFDDNWMNACVFIVAGFYLYFFYNMVADIRQMGWLILEEPSKLLHQANIVIYALYWGFKMTGYSHKPENVDITSNEFVDVKPFVETVYQSEMLNACNAFLSWFKLVTFLSLNPQFARITGTLSRAAMQISAFLVIFLIISFAFTTAFSLAFGSRLNSYRNLTATLFTLLKAILGDFNFDELSNQDKVFGPFLFICFISIAVFVILNVVIAIIASAYEETINELADMEDVKLGQAMTDYILAIIARVPVLGKFASQQIYRNQQRLVRRMEKNREKQREEYSANQQHSVMRKIRVDNKGKLHRGEERDDQLWRQDAVVDHDGARGGQVTLLHKELREVRQMLHSYHQMEPLKAVSETLGQGLQMAGDLSQSAVGGAVGGAVGVGRGIRATKRRATQLGLEMLKKASDVHDRTHGSAKGLLGGFSRSGITSGPQEGIWEDQMGTIGEDTGTIGEDTGTTGEDVGWRMSPHLEESSPHPHSTIAVRAARAEHPVGAELKPPTAWSDDPPQNWQEQHQELHRTVQQLSVQLADSTKLIQQLVGAIGKGGPDDLPVTGQQRSPGPRRVVREV
jgi:hypothetical protein